MKKYEFVSVHTETWFGAQSAKHRDIIRAYAGEGWRYAGFIPTVMGARGVILKLDLVFEKEAEETHGFEI